MSHNYIHYFGQSKVPQKRALKRAAMQKHRETKIKTSLLCKRDRHTAKYNLATRIITHIISLAICEAFSSVS